MECTLVFQFRFLHLAKLACNETRWLDSNQWNTWCSDAQFTDIILYVVLHVTHWFYLQILCVHWLVRILFVVTSDCRNKSWLWLHKTLKITFEYTYVLVILINKDKCEACLFVGSFCTYIVSYVIACLKELCNSPHPREPAPFQWKGGNNTC